MQYLSLTLPEFQDRFSEEDACLQAVFEAKWPFGFICPHCEHNDGYPIAGRRNIECACCGRQTSITADTLFERSHIPLVTWFLVIYFMAQDKGGVSGMRLANQLGMRYPTVLSMLHRLRDVMGARDENRTLAGYIELDEAFFGGVNKRKKYGNSAYANKRQVLIMVESEGHQAGNLVMRVIDNASRNTLEPILEKKIECETNGQVVRADGLQDHAVIQSLGHTLKMTPVPASMQDHEFPCLSLATTHLRRFLMGTFHHYCKVHLQRFLNEFCFRWNRRHQWCQLFSRLLKACALHPNSIPA